MRGQRTSFAHELAHSVAGAWRNWRKRRARIAELAACDPVELRHMAGDLNISCEELVGLVRRDNRSADLVERRLRALGFDPDAINADETAVMRDLQRCCSACSSKARCAGELDAGVTRGAWRQYCPNAETLVALLAERRRSPAFEARTAQRGK
jgi:hypothetical protein